MEIVSGFVTLFSDPITVGLVFAAAFIGIVIGATPGLTTAAAIAMLVPLTFFLEPLQALAFLYVIGKSGRYGGSIAAILFNTPGTAAAAATAQDGYPMCRAGKTGKALKTSAVASVFGDFLGDLLLIFGAAAVVSLTSDFGPPEFFAVYIAAFVIISSVIGSSVVKGLISAAAGAFVAMIGIDAMEGTPRLDFDHPAFHAGISLVPLLIGMFVLSEIALKVESVSSSNTRNGKSKEEDPAVKSVDNRFTFAEFRRCVPIMLRSSSIGAFIGLMPGLGSSVAAFAAYGTEKRRAKNSDQWGKGVIEGIAAPESANNAVNGPTMIPMLALGIPGGTISAILMGVFLIHGITIGPSIFESSGTLVYGLFAAGLVGIATYGLIGYYGSSLIGKIVALVPIRLIYPYIFLTCFVSAFSTRTSVFDVFVMAAAGFLGFLMRKYGYSTAAFIIAFVLARGAEEAFRQSLLLSDAGVGIFLQRPVAVAFFAIGALILGSRLWQSRQATRTAAAGREDTAVGSN